MPFDFVFLVPLRNVSKGSSLADIIIAEHDQLHNKDSDLIQLILEGKTEHSFLLILDGYDEYTPGTNTDIDKALTDGMGKCMCILTSRPDLVSGDDVQNKKIMQKIVSEVSIEGFSEQNVRKCCCAFLESDKACTKLIRQARKSGIYNLLSTPILLLMVCVLFDEDQSLPRSRTKIYETIYELTMDRTTLKTMQCKSAKVQDIDQMLKVLGKFSWKALQNDVRQLLINKVSFLKNF